MRICLFFVSCLLLTSARAQEPKTATLRWFGQSFFQLETATGRRIAFDPQTIPEFGRPLVRADVVLISHLHTDHSQVDAVENVKAARVFFGLTMPQKGRPADWNRVDEKIGPVRVRTVSSFHDTNDGLERGKNTIWIVEADGLVYCHLGDLGHELTPAQLKAIGPVDVLMIPVGGVYSLNGEQAKRVVGQIKPKRFILPMHYAVPGYDEMLTAEEFLDGQPNLIKKPGTNELTIPVDAKPPASPTVVVLGWKKDETAPRK